MPQFQYIALNSRGQEERGELQAGDNAAAAVMLREQGLRLLDLREQKQRSGFLGQDNFSDWLATQRSVSTTALIFFFRQMAFMLRAGLPAVEALDLATGQITSPRLNLAVRRMRKDIESGHALSAAMGKHSDVFSQMMINLVVAGENTGELDVIMERLALHLEKKSALRTQMVNAMIYPVIVIVAAIGVAIFMVVSIIPKFATFLQSQGRPLPASTQSLIDISSYIRSNGIELVVLAIAVIAALLVTYQTYQGRRLMDSLMLRLPVLGHLLQVGNMAQMTWALSILLRSGVTVFDALKITGNLLGNKIFADKVGGASTLIFAGRDLASSLRHPQIPVLVLQMIAVGERTGTLDQVLQELGSYYEKLLETGIKRLTTLVEPAMILLIGGMVGYVYYAFFQALFSLAGGR